MKTAFIVVDLGFGDAGKGGVVDWLAQNRGASAVVRYTGGPHAAHHVVRPDGTSHAFCQFGATFQPGVRSHLARGMIVKPENLLYEAQALESKGFSNLFARLSIDPHCRLVTSYHAMLCQMKEVARGTRRNGTVGIGAGEAALESEESPEFALRAGDLYQPETLRQKLFWHYEKKLRQAQELLRECAGSSQEGEVRAVYDSFVQQVRVRDVLALYRRFIEALPDAICADEVFMEQAEALPGSLIFEGAHAALLDRDRGYYPYVAKTDTTAAGARSMLEQAGFAGSIITLGAVRAFGYRHGPGPFVTEDARLNGVFEERHNRANEWQGSPRYGWFDLLAVRHGMQINRQVDALALTMLDHLYRAGQLRACVSYEYLGRDFGCLEEYFETISSGGRVKITGIKPVSTGRKDTLAHLLFDCVPWDWVNFDDQARSGEDFIRFLESPDGLGLPVRLVSTGPTAVDKTWRAAPGSTTEE